MLQLLMLSVELSETRDHQRQEESVDAVLDELLIVYMQDMCINLHTNYDNRWIVAQDFLESLLS